MAGFKNSDFVHDGILKLFDSPLIAIMCSGHIVFGLFRQLPQHDWY